MGHEEAEMDLLAQVREANDAKDYTKAIRIMDERANESRSQHTQQYLDIEYGFALFGVDRKHEAVERLLKVLPNTPFPLLPVNSKEQEHQMRLEQALALLRRNIERSEHVEWKKKYCEAFRESMCTNEAAEVRQREPQVRTTSESPTTMSSTPPACVLMSLHNMGDADVLLEWRRRHPGRDVLWMVYDMALSELEAIEEWQRIKVSGSVRCISVHSIRAEGKDVLLQMARPIVIDECDGTLTCLETQLAR